MLCRPLCLVDGPRAMNARKPPCKTVPASEFRPLVERNAASGRQKRLHGIWRRIHGGFVLPESVCAHSGGWEVYDADLAGCKQCGAQHCCSGDSCTLVQNEQVWLCACRALDI